MSKHLQRDLEQLDRGLLGLAAEVEAAVRKAVQALRERSPQHTRPANDVEQDFSRSRSFAPEASVFAKSGRKRNRFAVLT